MVCPNCGKNISSESKFCPNCGIVIDEKTRAEQETENILSKVTSLKLKDMFSDVFKRHSTEQSEEAFAAGTHYNTVEIDDLIVGTPKPWLFARVFGVLLLVCILLTLICIQLQNSIVITGIMFIGSLIVPFTILIFLFESNIPKNISILRVVQLFFIGGVMSILVSLILFEFVVIDSSVLGAFIIGIVEEVGKFSVVYFVIKRYKSKYILNGLLIGASIGAGFAVFESAGYALNSLLSSGLYNMLENVLVRGVLSFGGHVTWAAISGGAILYAASGEKISRHTMKKKDFLKFFLATILLHAVWDFPAFTEIYWMKYIVLVLTAVVLALKMLSKGLKQLEKIKNEHEVAMVDIEFSTEDENLQNPLEQ